MPERTAHLSPSPVRAIIALCAAAAVMAAASGASAAPATARGPVYSAKVENASASVPLRGKAAFTIVSRVETGAPYVEVRVRVLRPSGKLLYQRTKVFNHVASSTVPAQFELQLDERSVREGRYPIEARVRARGTTGKINEADAGGRFFVYDPEAPRVPLAIVVRICGAPDLDPEGRFVSDPDEGGSLEAAEGLAALASSRSAVRLSAGIAPVTLEQWSRASKGFRIADAAGVREYGAATAAARRHAALLDALGRVLSTGRLELLDVPFADPDATGLTAVGGIRDLSMHFLQGRSAYQGALAATPAPGVLMAAQALPPAALPTLASQDVSYAVLAPGSLTARAAASGTWRIADSTLTALVADPELGRLAASAVATPGAALDRLFELRSAAPTAPVTAVVDLGPGMPGDAASLDRFLSQAESCGWVRPVSASEAARARVRGTTALAPASARDHAPAGYRAEVADARRATLGLAAAAGAADDDAETALWRLMIAESSRWAGADGEWGIADRGRAFAAAAARSSEAVFAKVALDVEDVTLSGNSGTVPVVVVNGTDKPLSLALSAESDTLMLDRPRTAVLAKTGENYATIPVDLRGAISAEMTVTLLAGDLAVSSRRVTVNASVLDRLVVIGGVVLVLIGLLAVVYRRRASGGVSEPDDAGRIGASRRPACRTPARSGKRAGSQ